MQKKKSLYSLNKKYTYLVGFARFIFALSIFYSVWVATIATFLLDWIDGEIFKRAGIARIKYDIYDKIADSWWYLMVLSYIFIKNVALKELLLLLFLFRTFGHIIFFAFKKRESFIFFPNLFELTFHFYLLSLIFPELKQLLEFPRIIYLILAIISLGIVREYFLHVKKINLSWIFFGKTTYWIDRKH